MWVPARGIHDLVKGVEGTNASQHPNRFQVLCIKCCLGACITKACKASDVSGLAIDVDVCLCQVEPVWGKSQTRTAISFPSAILTVIGP